MLTGDRRGFLRGLVTLPLIGGGVTLIGNPIAAAIDPTPALIDSYNTWLILESRWLQFEVAKRAPFEGSDMIAAGGFRVNNAGWHAQWRDYGDTHPSSINRAAVILAAAGCDWRA